jgi:YVTN family beta-propeller protein
MLLIPSALLLLAAAASPSPAPYTVTRRAVLGGDGGWDYITVDAAARRVFVARSTRVLVLDADTLELVGEIPDTPGVHGVAIASDVGRGFASNGRDNSATVFELGSLKTLAKIPTGTNPDALLYDAPTHRVFVFNGASGDITVIDAAKATVAGTIPVGGKLEAGVSDGAGHVYVNVEDKNQVAAVDARRMAVTARWPLKDCAEPTGLALDAAHRRLFSVCDGHMAVLDADSGRQVATVPIGAGPDGAVFDAERQLAFSSNGRDGTVTVVRERAPDRVEVEETLPTQPSARTIALDTKTHALLLPAAQFGPRPPASASQPRPRPPVLPGTFTVLVVGR